MAKTAAPATKPRKRGRPKGAKNKSTQIREAAQRISVEAAELAKTTPLEAMLMILADAMHEWQDARSRYLELRARTPGLLESAETQEARAALKADLESARQEFRVQEGRISTFGTGAAPYCHARLAQVDGKLDTNLNVTIAQFVKAIPAGPAVKVRS